MDIAIGVTLSRFFIQATIWLKISHLMTRVGSLSTHIVPSFPTSLDGLINQSEKVWNLHENVNNIPRLRDIWIFIDPLPLGSYLECQLTDVMDSNDICTPTSKEDRSYYTLLKFLQQFLPKGLHQTIDDKKDPSYYTLLKFLQQFSPKGLH